MSWSRPDLSTIYSRIKADIQSNVTDGVPIPRVSMLGILAAVQAGGVHLCYGFLQWIKNQIFVDAASSWGIERWSNILNIPRKAAQYSTGYLSFTGTATHEVSVGTLVVNGDGYEYETLADFIIGTDDEVAAQAVESGADSNTDAATMTLSSPDPDIDSVVNVVDDPDTGVTSFQDGADPESEEAWVLRMLHRFQNPPACGNSADYIRWALEVPGVTHAWCRPAEDLVQGSVGIYIAQTEVVSGITRIAAASDALKTDVEDYIEAIRPAPAYIVYNHIITLAMDFWISITPNIADMATAIRQSIADMILTDAAPGGTLRISHIRSAIAATGVDDYEITFIRAGTIFVNVDDVVLPYPYTARYGEVTFADL